MQQVTIRGVTLGIHEREEWQRPEEPVHSSNPFPINDVHYAVQHWPGASDSWLPPQTDEAVITHMRTEQHDYLINRGFSIGYGFEISQTAFPNNIWECRGFDFRNAANNGDKPPFNADNFNKFSISIQYHASVAHPITEDQILAGRYLIAHCDDVMGEVLTVQGHRDSDLTTCPGDVIYSKLSELATRPIEQGEPELTDEEINKIAAAVWRHQVDGKAAGWRLKQVHGILRYYLGGWRDESDEPGRSLLKQIWNKVSSL